MEAVITQVSHLAGTASEATRKNMIDQLRELSYSLESPDDTLQRITYLHLELAAVRVGVDLKLFELLAASASPMTVEQLREKTGAASVLLGRLLRYLSSVALIKEIRSGTFGATNVTQALALSGTQAAVHHHFDFCGPMFQELPDFLAKNGYKDITDNANTVHQAAWKTKDPLFVWMAEHPETAAHFNDYMAYRRKDMPTGLDVFPVEEEVKGTQHEVIFVDVGGNVGHQCAVFKAKYPHLPGRVVLQDLPHAITMALQTPGVENTIYDIFTPQPVKDAKFYYIAHVLHDFPDDKCRTILGNIESAMSEDSVILIDEMLIPEANVHWHVTQIDLAMMTAMASIERTQVQWAALLDSVGLKIRETYMYTPSVYESIMVVVRK